MLNYYNKGLLARENCCIVNCICVIVKALYLFTSLFQVTPYVYSMSCILVEFEVSVTLFSKLQYSTVKVRRNSWLANLYFTGRQL